MKPALAVVYKLHLDVADGQVPDQRRADRLRARMIRRWPFRLMNADFRTGGVSVRVLMDSAYDADAIQGTTAGA